MRLTCPRCAAQYEIAEDLIPETGREVECSACAHVWLARRGDLEESGAGRAASVEDRTESAVALQDGGRHADEDEAADADARYADDAAGSPLETGAQSGDAAKPTAFLRDEERAPGATFGHSIVLTQPETGAADRPQDRPADEDITPLPTPRLQRQLPQDVLSVLLSEAARERSARQQALSSRDTYAAANHEKARQPASDADSAEDNIGHEAVSPEPTGEGSTHRAMQGFTARNSALTDGAQHEPPQPDSALSESGAQDVRHGASEEPNTDESALAAATQERAPSDGAPTQSAIPQNGKQPGHRDSDRPNLTQTAGANAATQENARSEGEQPDSVLAERDPQDVRHTRPEYPDTVESALAAVPTRQNASSDGASPQGGQPPHHTNNEGPDSTLIDTPPTGGAAHKGLHFGGGQPDGGANTLTVHAESERTEAPENTLPDAPPASAPTDKPAPNATSPGIEAALWPAMTITQPDDSPPRELTRPAQPTGEAPHETAQNAPLAHRGTNDAPGTDGREPPAATITDESDALWPASSPVTVQPAHESQSAAKAPLPEPPPRRALRSTTLPDADALAATLETAPSEAPAPPPPATRRGGYGTGLALGLSLIAMAVLAYLAAAPRAAAPDAPVWITAPVAAIDSARAELGRIIAGND